MKKSAVWAKEYFNKSLAVLKARVKSGFSGIIKIELLAEDMKIILSLVAIASFFAFLTCSVQKAAIDNLPQAPENEQREILQSKNKTPVLVELFTSEGCSTCPPADRTLAILEKEQPNPEAEIITLALHVDYWNRLGWTDEFSSPIYSQRQEIYGDKFKIGSVYTPQMVVDGSRHLVGSNLGEAQKVIAELARMQKASVELSLAGEKLKVKISDIPKHENATVFLAVAEDNLSTDVKKGENGGRILQHTSVVRVLKPMGRILAQDNGFEIEAVLETQPNWKRENVKVIVFIQENQSRKILGVNRILPDNTNPQDKAKNN